MVATLASAIVNVIFMHVSIQNRDINVLPVLEFDNCHFNYVSKAHGRRSYRITAVRRAFVTKNDGTCVSGKTAGDPFAETFFSNQHLEGFSSAPYF